MGKIYTGFPPQLADFLIKDCKIVNFVETGTYLGFTCEWAAKNFKNVYTIEASKSIFNNTKKRLNHLHNIRFYLGESDKVLKIIKPVVKKNGTVYWLDAHWSGENTYGDKKECPVLQELKVINSSDKNFKSIIIIDDASCFLAPPPLPHNAEEWPSISEIVFYLKPKDRYILIWQDTIIAVPKKMRKNLVDYIRKIEAVENCSKSFYKKFIIKVVNKFTSRT